MNKHIPQYKDFHSGGPSVLQYLNNTLTLEEKRKLEERFSDDQMLVDAIEGLREMDLNETAKIDSHLKKYIKHKIVKKERDRKQFSFPSWLITSLIILLLLISLGYFVISKLLG
jgi:hypothetical protein